MTRPATGTRVRVLETTGIANVAGELGTVVAHHEDGVAIVVDVYTGDRDCGSLRRIVCEPSDVELVRDERPARIIGSAT